MHHGPVYPSGFAHLRLMFRRGGALLRWLSSNVFEAAIVGAGCAPFLTVGLGRGGDGLGLE